MGIPSTVLELAAYCRREGISRLRVVADENTWAAFGEAVATGLRSSGLAATETIFPKGVEADEKALGFLLSEESEEPAALAAVGSGTITDIARFYASRMRLPFFSLPTAASVDAYASSVAAMSLGGAKRTVNAIPPRAIFVDTEVLRAAPPAMTAAGFADTICKFGALADWRLGALVWGEAYDEPIASRSKAAAESCAAAADLVGRRELRGIEILIEALLESGRAMSLAGHSRSASGAEHHLSHYWEMALSREGLPPLLHGLKVGVATVMMAELWERIGTISAAEATKRLDGFGSAGIEAIASDEGTLLREFGKAGPAIIATQRRFLGLDAAGLAALKESILHNWYDIRGIAASVPGSAETIELLERAGCPTRPIELGLDRRLVEGAWRFGHCLRDRFTVRRLAAFLGVDAIPERALGPDPG
ncbi:MAG TPA: sn-glycerol-1-phosphate dehydrogenase [Rectinemataceae bacterium]|nr:sn-glycerol-1-phosphate dehydrogenase [Rectinemataceae bacterium]